MAFWRGETLLARLPGLITPSRLFNPKNVDCAAYTLTLGHEVFVTSDLPDVGSPHQGVKTVLKDAEQIRITPGQFAFLLSQETVEIPNTAIAFISMKATYKLRGLINVSGFHVDPGWKNPLLFSVYNAGPSPVVLTQGMQLFLVWFADLDDVTTMTYQGKGKSIDADLISNMSGQVFSPIALKKEVEGLVARLGETNHGVAEAKASIGVVSKVGGRIAIIAVTAAIGAIGYLFIEQGEIKRDIAVQNALTSASRVTHPALSQTPAADKRKGEEARKIESTK